MEEPFERQPVYAKLTWSWSWHGIEISTPLFGATPGLVLFPVGAIWGAIIPCFACVMAGALVSCVLQYNRDENLLASILRRHRVPKHLVPVAPVADFPPFPVPRQRLL